LAMAGWGEEAAGREGFLKQKSSGCLDRGKKRTFWRGSSKGCGWRPCTKREEKGKRDLRCFYLSGRAEKMGRALARKSGGEVHLHQRRNLGGEGRSRPFPAG